MFITITGMQHYLGIDVFRINQIVTLEKEEDNPFDDEAIKVFIEGGAQVGYVANSVYTKALGTKSSGYIARDIKKSSRAKICFITHDTVIAKLLEYEQE